MKKYTLACAVFCAAIGVQMNGAVLESAWRGATWPVRAGWASTVWGTGKVYNATSWSAVQGLNATGWTLKNLAIIAPSLTVAGILGYTGLVSNKPEHEGNQLYGPGISTASCAAVLGYLHYNQWADTRTILPLATVMAINFHTAIERSARRYGINNPQTCLPLAGSISALSTIAAQMLFKKGKYGYALPAAGLALGSAANFLRAFKSLQDGKSTCWEKNLYYAIQEAKEEEEKK
ncbi:TPA: hypothetical protein DCW54_03385 [Candidatus Dependentiae bacterium]|nr:hypothetical protein [Candidatus Dependentiae bacterium]